jgi:hypothetical protein
MKEIKYLVLSIFFTIIIFISINKTDETHIEYYSEIEYDIPIDDTNDYLDRVGERESNGRYHIVNDYGYMGKYQFSHKTLNGLGISVSKTEFLSNPQLQDSAMVALLIHNRILLKKYIDKYDGNDINGNIITESGILAAAHLIGPHRTKLLLTEGIDSEDAFGTSALSYLTEFSGYSLHLH